MKEKTLSIIKPNVIRKNLIGKIIAQLEEGGLQVCAMKMVRVPKSQWEVFYEEHRERPFFPELVDFMNQTPVVLMVLCGENAIARNREIMGDTDPAKAVSGSLRALYGDSVGENAVHGSDSSASAERELSLFFPAGCGDCGC